METVSPIINGSINPHFTPDLFAPLTHNKKHQVLWYLICSISRKESFPAVEDLTFSTLVPPPELPIKVYSEIDEKSEEELEGLFVEIFNLKKGYYESLMEMTKQRLKEKGQRIYRMQSKLGFGGFLEMDLYRLKGYINECGEWNDFSPAKISQQLNRVESQCPKKDYGVNNINTGISMHTYRTVHGCGYINLYFSFLTEKDKNRVMEFYKEVWEPVGELIKAGNVRIEKQDQGHGFYSIELIWWWD